jgi:PAS domain S-box-containing protein
MKKVDKSEAAKLRQNEEGTLGNNKEEHSSESIIANEEKEKREAELVSAKGEIEKRANELIIANIKKAERAEELVIANKELAYQNSEKGKRAAELGIANEEKAEREAELVIANEEKEKRADELVIANEEKEKRADELVIANEEKAEREAELVIANEEKEKRADELVIANEEKAEREAELVIANEEKAKSAAELIIAKAEKAKRAAELVIANADKAKRAAELIIANFEKEKRADELIIANKELTYQNEEKVKRAAELVIADVNKSKREAELVIANIEKAKRIAKSIIADKELSYQTKEKEKRATELVIANIKKAKRSAELIIANVEKANRSAELIIANKELAFQKSEKSKRAAELIIANIEKAKRAAELVIANIEKAKRAAEFVITNKELALAKEKAKLIVELILANEAILQSEENFRRSISESPLGIRIVSVDGEIIYANKAFLDIYGFNSVEELISIPAINQYTPESYAQHQERKKNRKNGHDVFDYEISIICKDAEIRHLKIWRREVLWNRTKHYQVINLDITEQKKLTTDLIAAKEQAEESDRLKSAFLTNMSHEIRTPMNGILGFAELLKEPNLTVEEQQDFIQTIQISGARMLNTINSIVDISKIESGLMKVDIKETNINEKMEFTYKFFKPEVERKGLQFLFKNGFHSKKTIIKTDSEKVYGMLTNLIKNAIKFTYEGSIEFGYEKKGEYLEFFVKDTGVGIPKNQMELIFERFRQGSESHSRGYEGSGLGLSIAKSYVEMLGGKIWVESEEGKGSIFYFTIPYNAVSEEKSAIRKAVSEEDKEVQVKKLKILIAEDDKISNSLLTRMLQKISYEVLHVKTGVEAVEACRNNPDLDLVMMDIKMPVMDGNEATRQIRQFNTDVIIIAQTAYAFSGDKELALEAGCNDYITKPINMTLLFELIKRHCMQKPDTQPTSRQ